MNQMARWEYLLGMIAVSFAAVHCSAMAVAERGGRGERVERWGIFELILKGPEDGNPFLDVTLSAQFRHGDRVVEPRGFYDGDGVYRIRFMPDAEGVWTYETTSNREALNGRKGEFVCVKASPQNHGPVRVHDTYRLAYADGTPHFSIGTTCYAWAHQGDALEEQTLATLRNAPFNKMRMCVFPKDYSYNKNEPKYYPFEGEPLKKWDYTRFNPAFFRHFEKRIEDLQKLGIEADIILFHPYDRWGFADMGDEAGDRYLRYVVARLAAYRNVWWSLANEYDLMKGKAETDWDRFFKIVQESDPYGHLRGVHNCRRWYDHSKPWVTHASLQTTDFRGAGGYREKYKKPIVYDECRYEGNIPQGWGNITAQQMVRNFWTGSLAGCYVGHGETYKHPQDILWWSKGGVLRGQSPARIAFLKKVITEKAPFAEMTPDFRLSPGNYVFTKPGEYYLIYFTSRGTSTFTLPGSQPYKADGIDPWAMTVTPIGSAHPGSFSFTPPQADYVLRLSPYGPGESIRPEARASASPTEGAAPLEVKFSSPTKLKPRWTFGDWKDSTEVNPVHVYEKPGPYTAMLTVTDEDGASASAAVSITALPFAPKDQMSYDTWPCSHDELVFLWDHNKAKNEILEEGGRVVRTCKVTARGDAKFGESFEMNLAKGAFLAEGVDDALLSACKKTNQLGIEAVITPGNVTQAGPARIVTFSNSHTSRNFTLGQEGDMLVLRLRTPRTGLNALNPQVSLSKLKAGERLHVIVAFFSGHLYCYLNGERVLISDAVEGDFSNWEKCHLLFGDEWAGGRDWAGQLESIALYSRFIGPEEAHRKHALLKSQSKDR